jgi:hypothetical protein
MELQLCETVEKEIIDSQKANFQKLNENCNIIRNSIDEVTNLTCGGMQIISNGIDSIDSRIEMLEHKVTKELEIVASEMVVERG